MPWMLLPAPCELAAPGTPPLPSDRPGWLGIDEELGYDDVNTGTSGRDSIDAVTGEVEELGPDDCAPPPPVERPAADATRRTSGAGGMQMPPTGLVRRMLGSATAVAGATGAASGRIIVLPAPPVTAASPAAGTVLAPAATCSVLAPREVARQRMGTSDDSDTSGEGDSDSPNGGDKHRLGIGDKHTSVAMHGTSCPAAAASRSTVLLLVDRDNERRARGSPTAAAVGAVRGADANAAPAGAITTDKPGPAVGGGAGGRPPPHGLPDGATAADACACCARTSAGERRPRASIGRVGAAAAVGAFAATAPAAGAPGMAGGVARGAAAPTTPRSNKRAADVGANGGTEVGVDGV